MPLLGSFSEWFAPNTAECAAAAPMVPGMTPIDAFNQTSGSTAGTSNVSAPPPANFNLGGDPMLSQGLYPSQGAELDHIPEQQPAPPKVEYTSDGRCNPGGFDKADSEAQRVLKPDIFDGGRFEHNKHLGPQFSITHSLWLGSAMLPGNGNHYQFGSTVVLNEGRTMVLGRISDDYRVDAQFHHEVIQPQKLVTRVIASLSESAEQSATHASVEYNGIDYAASMKLSKGPMIAGSYFQSITKSLNMGAEAFFHQAQGVAHVFARATYKPSVAATEPNDIFNATLSTVGALNLNYVRKVNDRVHLAAELDYSLATSQSHMSVGYEFMLRQCKISGVVSSDGMIQNQVTEAIAPGFHIIFNSILDHKRDTHRFGYGVQIG